MALTISELLRGVVARPRDEVNFLCRCADPRRASCRGLATSRLWGWQAGGDNNIIMVCEPFVTLLSATAPQNGTREQTKKKHKQKMCQKLIHPTNGFDWLRERKREKYAEKNIYLRRNQSLTLFFFFFDKQRLNIPGHFPTPTR